MTEPRSAFGAELRTLRENAGLSLRQLVDATGYDHTYLWEVETGRKPGTATVARLCDRALGTGTVLTDRATLGEHDPLVALATLGKADVNRRRFLRSIVYTAAASTIPLAVDVVGRVAHAAGGREVGAAEVQAVRDITTAFTELDERSGGLAGRTAVAEFISSDVADYCRATFATDADRRAMFGAAAEAVYLAGWKAHDIGRDGLAQRYYLHAFQLAAESDPHGHAAYVLRILAHQAMDIYVPTYCVDLAEAALARARGHVDPETESLFRITLARAHATAGNKHEALRAVARTEQVFAKAEPATQPPRWAALWGSAVTQVHSHAGKTLAQLGDLTGAEEQFRRTASLRDRIARPRPYALDLANVAKTQHQQGRTDDACETWRLALPYLETLQSARTAKDLRTAREHLALAGA